MTGLGRCLLLALWLAGALVWAQEADPETRIKAAFLYKFCNYIEWPAHSFVAPDAPLIIAVVGDEALAREVQLAVAERRIAQRPLRVRRLAPGEALAGVHVLFIGQGLARERDALFAAASQHAVLTVTEAPQDAAPGIINFVVVDNRVRFDIAQDQAVQSGLRLSSQLLAVARNVRGGAQP